MVDMFLEAGFTYFDTAWAYPGSEDAIRQALVERYPRKKFQLATKNAAWINCKTREEAVNQFETSLKQTGAGYFDFYLLHNLGESRTKYFDDYNMWDFVQEQKAKGLIKHVGFSFHSTPEELDAILNTHPEMEFVQLQINYADWDYPAVQSRRCYEVARKHGKPVIIMEPVKGGMLTYPPKALFEQMQAKRPGMTPAAWALRFAADQEGVQAILSGMSTVEQVLENTAVMEDPEPLTDEEKQMLIDSAPLYREMGPFHIKDFSVYDGLVDNVLPLAALLESYNAWLIQKEHGAPICAEFSYYAGPYFRSGVKGSWVEGTITDKDGKDITETVKEAEAYFKTFIDWVN